MRWIGPLVIAGMLSGAPGCASAPPAQSPQKEREVILQSEDVDLEQEKEIGRRVAQQVEQEMGLVTDPALLSYVQSIGSRLAAQSPRTEVEYQFQIIDSSDVNAFALPGGYIYVTRGLLALTNSEAELANVLAHEVGHVAARHHSEQQSRARNVGILSTVGVLAAAVMGSAEAAQLLAGLTQTVGAGYMASNGRDQEREADALGQTLAARAGWDPLGMSAFLRTLDRDTELQIGEKRKTSFLDTHPATPERVGVTAARARQLQAGLYEWNDMPRDEFLDRIRGIVLGTDPAQGIFEDEAFLHRDFDLSIRFPNGWLTRNTASTVGAVSQNQAALIKLELDSRGTDVRQAATNFLATLRGRVVRKNGFRIGDLPAYRALVVEGESAVEITWFTHQDVIFRLTGVTAAQKYPRAYERLFKETAESVRPLRPDEIQRIQRLTLGTALARSGETLSQFSERTGNQWSLDETATANGIFAYDVLKEGQLLKVALAEVYEPDRSARVEPAGS